MSTFTLTPNPHRAKGGTARSRRSRMTLRGLTTMSLSALLATVAALVLTAPAHAGFQTSENLQTQKNFQFCIGISGASTASGAEAGLFHCSFNGGGNQEYRFFGTKQDATIVPNHSKRCLRIRNNSFANGAQVVQGSCTSVSARWELTNFQRMGAFDYTMASIRNRYTGKCIGYSGGLVFNGAQIQVFNCDGAGNQNWVVNPSGTRMP